MITLDLHVHTTFSDGKVPLPQMVDLCGQAGLDAIAVTDHLCTTSHVLGLSARLLKFTLTYKNWKDYLSALEKEKNRAWREYKMILMPGFEYSRNTFNHRRNAHMLAVDVKDFIPPELSEEDWLQVARDQGCLTVAAHPLKLKDASSQTYYLLENHEKFSPLIDVWEAANAQTLWREMLKTPFSLLASSDLHVVSKWPSWRTQVPCEKDPEAIKSYLKHPASRRDFVFIEGYKTKIKHRVRLNDIEEGVSPCSRYSASWH